MNIFGFRPFKGKFNLGNSDDIPENQDGTLIGSIKQINTALSDLTESVSITADGVKTRSQLLNELYAAADMTKLTNRAVIVRGVFIYHLVRDTNFTCCNWTDTSPFVQVQYIKLLASGSVQGFVTPSANTDQSSSSETSGVEYTLYY